MDPEIAAFAISLPSHCALPAATADRCARARPGSPPPTDAAAGFTLLELLLLLVLVAAAVALSALGGAYGGVPGGLAGLALLPLALWLHAKVFPGRGFPCCPHGTCRTDDYIFGHATPWGPFVLRCRCGLEFLPDGARVLEILPEGTVRPFRVWRPRVGWTEDAEWSPLDLRDYLAHRADDDLVALLEWNHRVARPAFLPEEPAPLAREISRRRGPAMTARLIERYRVVVAREPEPVDRADFLASWGARDGRGGPPARLLRLIRAQRTEESWSFLGALLDSPVAWEVRNALWTLAVKIDPADDVRLAALRPRIEQLRSQGTSDVRHAALVLLCELADRPADSLAVFQAARRSGDVALLLGPQGQAALHHSITLLLRARRGWEGLGSDRPGERRRAARRLKLPRWLLSEQPGLVEEASARLRTARARETDPRTWAELELRLAECERARAHHQERLVRFYGVG
ncbi:MAG: hypothetical protein HZA54_16410 [Planctomycetes bacterium]|nr:hypothetical protein [Planctomycetota bacterium]